LNYVERKKIKLFYNNDWTIDRFCFVHSTQVHNIIVHQRFKYKEVINSDFTHRQLIIIKGYNLCFQFQTNHLKNNVSSWLSRYYCQGRIYINISRLPDVFIGITIFFTIPVKSSSPERSFSKHKLIKNYFWNSIGQERLSSQALINIERQQTNYINTENVILWSDYSIIFFCSL